MVKSILNFFLSVGGAVAGPLALLGALVFPDAVSAQAYPSRPMRYIVGDTPEQFTAFIKTEIVKWAKAVKASGAKPE
jgi:tripartite-type tricarboxylate transporter receptor subunit TctC